MRTPIHPGLKLRLARGFGLFGTYGTGPTSWEAVRVARGVPGCRDASFNVYAVAQGTRVCEDGAIASPAGLQPQLLGRVLLLPKASAEADQVHADLAKWLVVPGQPSRFRRVEFARPDDVWVVVARNTHPPEFCPRAVRFVGAAPDGLPDEETAGTHVGGPELVWVCTTDGKPVGLGRLTKAVAGYLATYQTRRAACA